MRLTRRLFVDPFKYYEEPIKYLKDPKLVALKAQRRQEMREEYYKKKLSPYSYTLEAEGTVFDPAIMRYNATHAHMEDYFRATPKSTVYFLTWIIAPMVILAYFFKRDKDRQELEIRMGYRAYADKDWKFDG